MTEQILWLIEVGLMQILFLASYIYKIRPDRSNPEIK
jgi:hypothetical protein